MKPSKVNLTSVPRIGNFIYIIKPTDGAVIEGKVLIQQPSLEMLQFGVEGSIELIPKFDKFGGRPCVAFCNEEGKILGLQPNPLAQILWEQCVGNVIKVDHLVGNIVVIVADPAFLERM
jgi:hypothetical protein